MYVSHQSLWPGSTEGMQVYVEAPKVGSIIPPRRYTRIQFSRTIPRGLSARERDGGFPPAPLGLHGGERAAAVALGTLGVRPALQDGRLNPVSRILLLARHAPLLAAPCRAGEREKWLAAVGAVNGLQHGKLGRCVGVRVEGAYDSSRSRPRACLETRASS